MGKAIRASALALLLACSAQAGIMQNGSPESPPSQTASTVEGRTGGEIPNEVTAAGIMPNEAPDSLTQIALQLLAALF